MRRDHLPDYIKHDLRRGIDFIGVTCVFLCHDGGGKFVLQKRSAKCRDEQGRWDPGGGALEHGESFEDAIRREVHEEYCTDVDDVQFINVRNVLRTSQWGANPLGCRRFRRPRRPQESHHRRARENRQPRLVYQT